MIEGARFPGRLRVATGTFCREFRSSMSGIGRSIVILQVTTHTRSWCADKPTRMTTDAIYTDVATC